MPLGVHQELHARGFNDAIKAHFYPGDRTWPIRTTPAKFEKFLNQVKKSSEFKDLFDSSRPATVSYKQWRAGAGRLPVALAGVGLVLGALTVSASAQSIECNMKQFGRDRANGNEDWAYVDALMVRQELNSRGAFVGDAMMRAMYKAK
jgi:hypothetical protein